MKQVKKTYSRKGFALIEVLMALTVASIVFVTMYSAVTNSIFALLRNRKYSKGMMIAKTKLNEFIINKLREPDANEESMEDYPDFRLTRTTERFEHPMLEAMPLPLYSTKIKITWREGNKDRSYQLTYVYPKK